MRRYKQNYSEYATPSHCSIRDIQLIEFRESQYTYDKLHVKLSSDGPRLMVVALLFGPTDAGGYKFLAPLMKSEDAIDAHEMLLRAL
jgi:hypothetical protein